MRSKRGVSVFTIDAVVAALIITVGILLVFLQAESSAPIVDPGYDIGQNVVDLLSNTRVDDAGLDYTGVTSATGTNTLLVQVGEYHLNGHDDYTRNMLDAALGNVVGENLGVEIRIKDSGSTGEGNLVYSSVPSGKPRSGASIVVPFKKIIYGYYGLDTFWSYILEIWVWQ